MSSSTIPLESVAANQPSRVEGWFRRALWIVTTIVVIGILCHFGLMLWAQHEFSQPESIVAAQSMMLAHDGTLYYGLKTYPFTVNAYMPLFYLLDAALIKAGLPVFAAGRLISFGALIGIFSLTWRMLWLYTSDRYCAWMGTLLCASTSLLLSWGTVAQVDTLALCLAMAGFYYYSRYTILGENTLPLAAAFVIAAVFTKQTMLACPTAIFFLLWFRNPKTAIKFGAATGGVALAAALIINAALHGRFFSNTVFSNLNPFAAEKVWQHAQYIIRVTGPLAIVAIAGAKAAMRGRGKALYGYLALAAAVLAVTAPKIGSDSNYQLESTVLLILCSCATLQSLNFFPLLFQGSKSRVTLLQLALAVYLINNFRLTESFLATRLAREQLFRQEITELQPYIATHGRVISTDIDAMVHLRGRIDIEPLIYTLLVHAGRIDPEPVRRDLAAGAIPTVVLYQDLRAPLDPDPELPTLPAVQLDEIRKHYILAAHIPGPYLDGVFVYKPSGAVER
jgi:hypothetical protein